MIRGFEQLLNDYRSELDDYIREEINTRLPADSPLRSPLLYHFETGGKRFRAVLPVAVADALDGNPRDAFPVGAACELFHNGTLVHDDIQDSDARRRGKPSVWSRFDTARAINVGDACFFLANAIISETSVPHELARYSADGMLKLIDGQDRELTLEDLADVTTDEYLQIAQHKTGQLFGLGLAGGAFVAGRDDLVENLHRTGEYLGVIYQIRDDFLDIFSPEQKGHGSETSSDLVESKPTILNIYTLQQGSPEHRRELLELIDKARETNGRDRTISRASRLYQNAGATNYGKNIVKKYKQRIIEELLSDVPNLENLLTDLLGILTPLPSP